MEYETLFFKSKQIQGSNVEMLFHKDFTYFYNPLALPVVKFTLLNCEDPGSINFENLDSYNDGVVVETREMNGRYIFEAMDIGGRVFQILCQKIIREELEYRKEDYADLINELLKERDDAHAGSNINYQRNQSIILFLEKKIATTNKKIEQAVWLTRGKKKFLEGELAAYKKVLELMNK
jgi:hypothetical protein